MSFALSMDDGRLEWGSDNLDTVFAQRRNIASPSFLGMLRDVIRFGKEAPKVREVWVVRERYERCVRGVIRQANRLSSFVPLRLIIRFWTRRTSDCTAM